MRAMWLFALFDLPMQTKAERREYARFRKTLIEAGFTRLQFSVYAQFCSSEEASAARRRRVRFALPPEGQVRLVSVTDRQFADMEVFLGETADEPEKPPDQMLLF